MFMRRHVDIEDINVARMPRRAVWARLDKVQHRALIVAGDGPIVSRRPKRRHDDCRAGVEEHGNALIDGIAVVTPELVAVVDGVSAVAAEQHWRAVVRHTQKI